MSKKVEFLRKKYPKFIYQKYSYKLSGKNLEIFFDFKIEANSRLKAFRGQSFDIFFKPKIVIENVKKSQMNRLGEGVLNNLIFHLGLIEIPSYWKATCSPEIIIEAGLLKKEQINWWKNLILKGMGQFFYENQINFLKKDFLKIKTSCGKFQEGEILRRRGRVNLKENNFLVPIGGGKDSIVTLEKLKEKGLKIGCFLVNPRKTMEEIVKVAKIKNLVIVRREIDPNLLKLNKKGYLNGHTPFTAVLSFLAVFCAVLFGWKNIAFSNQKSTEEGNLKYLGKIINHQWSKTFEFEKKFKTYCRKYLVQGINYFSFLRKYRELEISKIFIQYPQYFSVFSSCNVVLAKKLKKRWCGNCAKCLFVYASLYPFLEKRELLKIFGRDIFENKKLLPIMESLIGKGKAKPFECVGTFQENRLFFQLSFQKAKKENKIPWLLRKFNSN